MKPEPSYRVKFSAQAGHHCNPRRAIDRINRSFVWFKRTS